MVTEMDKPPALPSAQPSMNWLTGSLKEQHSSTLQTAIRSPSDQGQILRRANAVLSLYYDPDLDTTTKAELRQEFVIALNSYPQWAIEQAFDRWVRDYTRRPSPGEIAILASRAMEPIAMELAERDKQAAYEAEMRADQFFRDRTPEEKERADAIARDIGFTTERAAMLRRFPLSRTMDEAKEKR